MSADVSRTVDAGLQVVFDKDGDTFVAKAVRTGKTIAKGGSDRCVDYAVEELVAALIPEWTESVQPGRHACEGVLLGRAKSFY